VVELAQGAVDEAAVVLLFHEEDRGQRRGDREGSSA
jgi:hypothetical protein